MGYTSGNLPARIQFLGRMFDEGELIKLSYYYEQATKHRKSPNLSNSKTSIIQISVGSAKSELSMNKSGQKVAYPKLKGWFLKKLCFDHHFFKTSTATSTNLSLESW